MPSYHQISDEDWDAIIAYFQHMADEKIHYRSKHKFDTESTEFAAGQMLHEIGQCNSCHFYGEEFPTGDAPTWAPNLALTKERLNPEWVHDWLKNPQEIMPGTKMPAPYLPDENVLSAKGAINDWGRELVQLNGDTTAMLDGLTDYLWNIKGSTDIDAIIKDYFDKNGYEFESTSNNDDEYDDDDDWGDDEYDEDDDW